MPHHHRPTDFTYDMRPEYRRHPVVFPLTPSRLRHAK